MKSLLALSGIALVISAHTALADPGRPLDPHERARQSILNVTQHSAAFRTTTATAALAPTDPHELARQRIVPSPVTGVAFRPAPATGSQPTIDPHERARRSILGSSGESRDQANAQAAEPVQRLWFADSHVSAFYAVDETDHQVLVVTEPGPQGEGHATRTEKQLADGERFAISLDGYGRNALTATLAVTRSGKDIDVQITTTPRERSVASRD
jgi:hypothetical protein